MIRHHFPGRVARNEQGIALVLTLAILAVVTLLLIAFLTSMRVENIASRNFNDVVFARELAQGAAAQAVAQLRAGTPANTAYVTAPGLAMFRQGGIVSNVPLYSLVTSSTSSNDLNAGFPITGQNTAFSGSNATIQVDWITVGTDGSIQTTQRLAGRFAFWVDDDACKININRAWVRGAPNPLAVDGYGYGDTSEIELRVLAANLDAFWSDIHANASPYPYTTVQEVRQANNAITAADFDVNKFYLTVYSDDVEDRDAWGRVRLDVTALTKANSLDNTTNIDTSAYARLADGALTNLCSSIGAFADKYGTDGLRQIIANIIAYQHDPIVTPPPDGGGDPPAYLGFGKTPYINEVQVKYDASSGTNVERTVTVELFYLYGADGSSFSTAGSLVISNLPQTITLGFAPTETITVGAVTFSAATPYRTFSATTNLVVTIGSESMSATNLTATYLLGSNRVNYAQVPLLAATVDTNAVTSGGAEAKDPAWNLAATEWQSYSGAGTLGSQNSTFPAGHDISKAVMRGAAMRSLGELGYIHGTGAWNRLILRPQPAAEKAAGAIPDWAMLDLFRIPNNPTQGRININSLPYPASLTGQRLVPLRGLLAGVVAAGTETNVAADINNGVYSDVFGLTNAYDSVGEVCEVASLANGGSSEFDKEAVIRRIANLLTVRSNVFTIWVVAQGIKDVPPYGAYAPPPGGLDFITSEVKAQAVVERYLDGGQVKFRTLYFRYLSD